MSKVGGKNKDKTVKLVCIPKEASPKWTRIRKLTHTYIHVRGMLHYILFNNHFFWFILNRSDIRHMFGPMPAEVTIVREVRNNVEI